VSIVEESPMQRWIAAGLIAVAAAGCDSLSKGPYAVVRFEAANGSGVWGRATFHQAEGQTFVGSGFNWSAPVAQALVDDTAGKVFMRADINALPPNRVFSITLHERADCSGNGAQIGAVLGIEMPKLASNGEGTASYAFTTAGLTVAAGPRSVVNRTLVVRELIPEPWSATATRSGAIVACGVVAAMD
jgi:Cu-Zn family superoxide dismutase